jgi:hypothetical protein
MVSKRFLKGFRARERETFFKKILKIKIEKEVVLFFIFNQPGPFKNPSKITNRFSFKEK